MHKSHRTWKCINPMSQNPGYAAIESSSLAGEFGISEARKGHILKSKWLFGCINVALYIMGYMRRFEFCRVGRTENCGYKSLAMVK